MAGFGSEVNDCQNMWYLLVIYFTLHSLLFTVSRNLNSQDNEYQIWLLCRLHQSRESIVARLLFNPLQTKRRPLYLKTQSVPRRKTRFISVIKTNQFML